MVIALFLLLPCILFSAEFTASVNKNEVGLGESFMLDLTLKDSTAKTTPSLEALKQAFTIHSQHQSYSTKIINGTVSSNHTWTFTLMPKEEGEKLIPSISLETSDGKLSTQPISMRITQERNFSKNQSGEDIRLEVEASNLNPYKNETFLLTVKLISKRSLANLQMEKFELEEAIVESAGKPVIGERIEKGMRVGVVDIKYLVTPLKSGPLKIPSITITGSFPQKRNIRSLFDDPFDAFPLMQELQPFALTTKEQILDIRPPVNGLIPWLPAKALEIQENLDASQTFREGEVFTRSFLITAEGIHSSQLPSLETKQDTNGPFKIYADKPELKDEIIDGKLKSYRTEQYTLIPQRSGELTLPEISLTWWDTEKGEKRETRVPSRSLQILPALAPSTSVSLEDEKKLETAETIHPIAYVIIGGLAILLTIVLILLLRLQLKMKRLLEVPKEKKIDIPKKNLAPSPRRKHDKLEDLNPT